MQYYKVIYWENIVGENIIQHVTGDSYHCSLESNSREYLFFSTLFERAVFYEREDTKQRQLLNYFFFQYGFPYLMYRSQVVQILLFWMQNTDT